MSALADRFPGKYAGPARGRCGSGARAPPDPAGGVRGGAPGGAQASALQLTGTRGTGRDRAAAAGAGQAGAGQGPAVLCIAISPQPALPGPRGPAVWTEKPRAPLRTAVASGPLFCTPLRL